MKRIELLKELEKFNEGNDLIIDEGRQAIEVTIDDWAGFDDDWNELFNDLSINVEEFINFLKNNSESFTDDFYQEFTFEDCTLILGYSSFDI